MASLQARHSRTCALGRPWTTFAAATPAEGCTCEPVYYTVVREGRRLHRERVGKNRKVAERARNKAAVRVDEGDWEAPKNVRFAAWADEWLDSLEIKATTVHSYRSTMAYAKAVFPDKVIRKIDAGDIARFNRHLRDLTLPGGRKLSASTRAKHLRVLGACFAAAIEHGYAARNPVKALPKAQRPRAAEREAAFFENAELPPLLAQLPEGLYRNVAMVALKTGCRQGELIGLTWADLDLIGGVMHVRRTRTDGHMHAPKSGEGRKVDLAPDVVDLLGKWWGELGQPGDDTIVFPGPGRDGYLDPSGLRRELARAMTAAGIDRIGPTGEPRTWHSLRHTFARIALEAGAPIWWVGAHMGHSSTKVTTDTYGHFERAARRQQVADLAGAFTV